MCHGRSWTPMDIAAQRLRDKAWRKRCAARLEASCPWIVHVSSTFRPWFILAPTRVTTIGLQETPLNRDGAHQDTKRHTPSTWQRTGCCARSPWSVGGVRYNRPFDPHWTSAQIVWHFGRCSNLDDIVLATEKPASRDRQYSLGWCNNWVRSTSGIGAWPEAILTVHKAARWRHQASSTRYALLCRRYTTVCLVRE